jgi:hypothetical protein
MRSLAQTPTRADERFWLVANIVLVGLAAATVLAAIGLG